MKLLAELPTPRVFKPPLFKLCDIIGPNGEVPKTKDMSDSSDEEEFRGFDEDHLEFNKNLTDITTSTPNKKQQDDNGSMDRKRKAEDPADDTPSEKRISLDSNSDPGGLMTDDEDALEASPKEDENLSTPERIRRAALARISRDSGVISPEPDSEETLTITVSEDKQVSVELRRDSEDSDSVKSFVSAVADPNMPVLSTHDQKLAAKAQEKYQQQVSDMQTLVEKVNRWHQYLKPILKASQERSEFDIHECGTEVLDTFHEDAGQNEATFADVMATKPDDHFARYFLATLMLVNTGNLKFTNKNTNVNRISEPSEMHLTLKSRVRLHEEIENMDAAVPCISTTSGKKKGKRAADVNICNVQKLKKVKVQASTSFS